ncbi:MAG: DegT/DnrJ/EryC1/StrS family aminotransferase [Actinomycetota bacterium]
MDIDFTSLDRPGSPERSRLTVEEALAAASVLREAEWSRLGDDWPLPAVDLLEARWAAAHGSAHAIAGSSGTAALTLTLQALGGPTGDEVLIPAYGCPAVDAAVLAAGLTPVHVDLDPATYGMSPIAAAAAVTARTAAMIVVHFAGQPARLRSLASVAERQGIALIEDACLAPGGRYGGGSVGAWGHAAVFSLGVRKPISAGEGGLITTTDAALAERLRRSRSLGADPESGDLLATTGNYRLTALQAAVALPQLARLEADRLRREQAAELWTTSLGVDGALQPLDRDPQATHCWAQFWLRCNEELGGMSREQLVETAQAMGLPLFAGWSRPNHTLGVYAPQRAVSWLRERGSGREPAHYEHTHCPHAEHAAFNEALLLDFPTLNAGAEDVGLIAERLERLAAAILG